MIYGAVERNILHSLLYNVNDKFEEKKYYPSVSGGCCEECHKVHVLLCSVCQDVSYTFC